MLSHRIQSRRYYSSNLLFVHWPRNTPAKKWKPIQTWGSNAEKRRVWVWRFQKFALRTAENMSGEGWKSRRGCVGGNSVIFLPTFKPYTCRRKSVFRQRTIQVYTVLPLRHTTQTARAGNEYKARESHTYRAMLSAMLMNFFLVSFVLAIAVKIGVEKCVWENLKTKTPGNVTGKWHGMGEYWFCLEYFYESAKHNTHPNREWSSSPRCRRHL